MYLQALHLVVLLLCGVVAGVASLSVEIVNAAAPELRGKRAHYKRDGVKRTIFQHAATKSSIDFVTNSGICETTPGVNQYSGYLSIGKNQSLFFWFFEARNDSQHAPLATWFNGGPGCSSMIGLFQENGPCRFIDNATEPELNPFSWNEYANMLYIDQPFGVGFSDQYSELGPFADDGGTFFNETTGTYSYVNSTYDYLDINSTVSAASNVWKLLQAFYAQFPQYENRDFAVFTESYGGHYGPEFASYFESQNAAIASGSVTGQNISLVALGINNGWFDSKIQEKAYIEFAFNNSYRPLINETFRDSLTDDYNNECLSALQNCTGITGSNMACMDADYACSYAVDYPIYSTQDYDFDVYDIRIGAQQPPEQYTDYLQREDVMKAIGAKSLYYDCNNVVSNNFGETGDHVRSFIPALSSVIKSGVTTLIWSGDADFICNWVGNLAVVDALDIPKAQEFKDLAVSNYTVNGTIGGTFKTIDNLSWLRVFQAGHEVPFYQPELSLQVFKQTMQKQAIFATKPGGEPVIDKKNEGGLLARPESLAVIICALWTIAAFS